MSVEIRIPTLGESITEAVVGKLLKRPGDTVTIDEAIAVLETDKVTIDLQAPAAGTIENLSIAEGAKVKIGDTVGSITPGPGGTTSTVKIGDTVGAITPGPGDTTSTSLPKVAAPPPLPRTSAAAPAPGSPPPTPVARAMAAQGGIDASAVAGTGAQGRVMKSDVANAFPAAGPAPSHVPSGADAREERVPMTPLRKRVAERLLQAQSTAAILTTFNEVDMSTVMSLRKAYQEKFEKKYGIKLGFMSFFVRAAVEALKNFPATNASLDGDDIVFHRYYDIGVAVSGSRGLVVPVVRDADAKSLAELERIIADFGTRAKNDKLTLGDLQGGTFTISNGGIFGSLMSTPILNPPQTAILGMHAIQDRPVVRDGQIVIRPMMYLALSYDHRLIDGREAVQFLVRLKECVEAPERILIEV